MNDPQPHYANDSIPCNECPAGVMRRHSIAYFTWLGEELITVPNFPAWVCDMCGKREYDGRAISMLVTLLNPEAGKPTRRSFPLGGKVSLCLRPAPVNPNIAPLSSSLVNEHLPCLAELSQKPETDQDQNRKSSAANPKNLTAARRQGLLFSTAVR